MKRIEPQRSKQVCRICGGAISVHQEVRGGICDDRRCRLALVELPRRHALEHRAKVARSLGLPTADELPLAVVPCYEPRVANLPEMRRRRFRDHLNEQISLAVASSSKVPASRTSDEPTSHEYRDTLHPTPVHSALLAQACGTCAGHCCSQGGDRAWLDTSAIQRYREGQDGIRPREILEAYLARLPQKSCRGSCVYHTATGCALPRPMRAGICNTFYCSGLQELLERLSEPGCSRALVVAMNGDTVVRSTMVAAGGKVSAGKKRKGGR